MQIDVQFPVSGERLPTDHLYLLYAALTRVAPGFHRGEDGLRFAPINGDRGEKGTLRLFGRSRLRLRLPAERIAEVLPLAGHSLEVGEHRILLKAPFVTPIEPAPLVAAKVVTYKHATDPVKFLEQTRHKLDELGIGGEPGIPLIETGARAGEPRRQVLRIKGRRVVGFALQVAGLTAEESVQLQEQGLGGRTRIGCGFFVPWRPKLS
jgi:CRISPR-associated protein Cas6